MSDSGPGLTRRGFLGGSLTAVVAAVLGRRGGAETPARPGRSRVVLVRDPEVVGGDGELSIERLVRMLDRGVTALVGAESATAAWRRLFRPDDVVGVKSNVWAYLRTPPTLEGAIRRRILGAGVAPENVAIDDRGVLGNRVFKRATALVNVRPMRAHHWSGLGTCLKNYIMFVPRPSAYHPNACADLGALWKRHGLAAKTRLNILVMLTPQFHGVGPHGYSSRYVWGYGGLILGTDPVAVDATGARIIQAKRDLYFGEHRPISPPPHHIELADTVHGLGNSSPARIDLIRIGSQEGVLV